jgi:hypothetical protein
MWVAGGSPGTFTEAGEMGLGVFCFAIGRPQDMQPFVAAYKTAIQGATPVGDYVNDNIMGVTNMLCMEDRAKAFETASNMGMNYYSSLAYHWLDNVPGPALPEGRPRSPSPRRTRLEQLSAEGTSRGRPRRLRPFGAALGDLGFDQLTFSPTTNTCPPRWWWRRWSCSAARGDPRVRYRPRALDDPVPLGGCGPLGVVTSFNMADVWEMAADAVPSEALVVVGRPVPDLRGAGGAGQPAGPAPVVPGDRPATTSPAVPGELHLSTSRPCWQRGSCSGQHQREPPLRGRRAALPTTATPSR